MLHNIEDKTYHCEYTPGRPPGEGDYLLAFSGDRVLFFQDTLPTIGRVPGMAPGELRFLFTISGVGFYRCETPVFEEGALHYESVQRLRSLAPGWLAFGGVTGYHLDVWYRSNRFCGVCAAPYAHKEEERALVCPSCGHTLYPGIAVAIIVGVLDGERILLTRYSGRGYRSHALIAGYVEIGEALEDAVRREIAEEVGLRVKSIRYFDNQPWGFSQSMLVGFFAELDGPDAITLDQNELSEAVWVRREEMEARDSELSLTAHMMEAFRKGLEGAGAPG